MKNDIVIRQAVPFFMIRDMDTSLDFYTQVLGFKITMKWEPNGKIEWCWLAWGGAAFMLQQYRQNIPAETRGIGVSICIFCDDALILYRELLDKGAKIPEPFVGNNLWVIETTDPDGYKIFFESSTSVPEGTSYSEYLSSGS